MYHSAEGSSDIATPGLQEAEMQEAEKRSVLWRGGFEISPHVIIF
jgi:hypothetical protein